MGKFRPSLEILDARDVPAVLLWTDASGDDQFDTAANWSLGDGSNRGPQAGDDLVFQANPSSGGGVGVGCGAGTSPPVSYPSYGMHPASGGDYNSVTLEEGYNATVTVTVGFNTRDLILKSGIIDQPGTGTDITVTGSPIVDLSNNYLLGGHPNFYWTGGTLNSDITSGAALHISGASALIAPANAGTLTTADTLDFLNGATAELDPGTVVITAGEGIYLDAATMDVMADPGDGLPLARLIYDQAPGATLAPEIKLTSGSVFHVVRRDTSQVNVFTTVNLPILIDGGTLNIDGGIRMTVGGNVGGGTGPSIKQLSGHTYLTAGSQLYVDNGITLQGGLFGVDINVLGSRADVMGDLLNDGATIEMGGFYGTFRVDGKVTWDSGKYRPRVNGNNAAHDLWEATGTFTINSNTRVEARVQAPNGVQQGDTWVILQSDIADGMTGTPSLPATSQNYAASDDYELGQPPNMEQRWLKKK